MSDTPSALLKPQEVASAFSVTTKTVYEWGRTGKLRVVKTLGGHSRFLRSEVQQRMIEQGIPGEP